MDKVHEVSKTNGGRSYKGELELSNVHGPPPARDTPTMKLTPRADGVSNIGRLLDRGSRTRRANRIGALLRLAFTRPPSAFQLWTVVERLIIIHFDH